MKSLFKLTLAFLVIAFSFTGCIIDGATGPQGPPGPPGPPGESGWAYIDVKYFNITRWTLAGNGRYFYAEVNNPAITNNVLYNGVVYGSLVMNYELSNEIHIPLPYDKYCSDNDGNQWTETVSFDIMTGRITFYYEISDFYTGNNPPACMFKIVAMW
jgi:hypothetical protein